MNGYILRPMLDQEDTNFIRTRWIESYRNSPFARHMRAPEYYAIQNGTIEALLDVSQVTICALEDDPTYIIGFAVHATSPHDLLIVHYLYVREEMLGQGFARIIFNAIHPTTPTACSHITDPYYRIKDRYDLISLRDYDVLEKINSETPVKAYPGWKVKQATKARKKRETK